MKRTPHPLGGRAARLASAALLVLAAACADDSPAPPTGLVVPDDGSVLAVMRCEVRLPAGELSCADQAVPGVASASQSPVPGPRLEQRTIGGQGVYLRLASSGINVAGGVFSMNVTVQNLATLAMGTADGAARHAEGLRVFFAEGPTPTGAGTVTIANATGTAFFTAADQPYFQYAGSIGGTDQAELGADGILSSAETSSAKSWQFNVAAEVTSFSFVVYVRTQTPAGTLATAAPQVTGVSAATLVPGQTVTLTGTNFNPTAANNAVFIGGVQASVTGASATSLNVLVPCALSGTVPVQVTQGGMTGAPLQRPLLGSQRTLGVGESVVVTTAAEVGCNEITASGVDSKYIVAVYNSATSPNSWSGVQISGDPLGAEAPAAAVSPALSLQGSPAAGALQQGESAHGALLEKNRAEHVRLRARFARDPRMSTSVGLGNADVVAPPATRTFHVSNINVGSICSNYYVAAGTRVYYSGKIAIYEDDATPAGLKAAANATMQDYYNRIGDQFNADMEVVVRENFGDVLRRDAVTDDNGVLVAFFTPLINNQFPGVAGFVVSCDQYPDADAAEPAVGGPYAGTSNANGSSNFGEVFYAYQPTSTGTGFGTVGTPDYWYRTIRSTFIHETKHVASMAARVANGSANLEEAWLEEGTARHSEELWMRQAVDNVAWKANTGYGSAANPINVYCDVRTPPTFNQCAANTRRPASIMQRHFFSLYTQMEGINAAYLSPFGRTPYDDGAYFYAISWSLARYAIDRYGASDAAFLTALTQSSTTGTANLAARAGVPIDRLLGGWALSLAADDYPGLATPGLDIQMPTWNFRNIYAGINADGLRPLAYPLVPTPLSYGAFAGVSVPGIYGGGVRWFEFSGVQAAPQLVRLRGDGGATLPSTVRVAIARVR